MRQTHNSNFEDSTGSPIKINDLVARTSNKRWIKHDDVKKSNNKDIEEFTLKQKKTDRSGRKLEKNLHIGYMSSEEGPRDITNMQDFGQ